MNRAVARRSGQGRSSRTSPSGSTGGPSSARATPCARCAAAGRRDLGRGTSARSTRARTRDSPARAPASIPAALARRQKQPVVGADVEPPLAVAERQRPPRAADAGIDDREMHADGHEADRVREDERALAGSTVGGIPWVMSMICASGAMRLMTPWHVPTKSSLSPKSLRNVMNTRASLTPADRSELPAQRADGRAATRRRAPNGSPQSRRRAAGCARTPSGRLRRRHDRLRPSPRRAAYSGGSGGSRARAVRLSSARGATSSARGLALEPRELRGDDRDVREDEDEHDGVRRGDVLALAHWSASRSSRRSASTRFPASSTRYRT